jgi:hypothetical protein
LPTSPVSQPLDALVEPASAPRPAEQEAVSATAGLNLRTDSLAGFFAASLGAAPPRIAVYRDSQALPDVLPVPLPPLLVSQARDPRGSDGAAPAEEGGARGTADAVSFLIESLVSRAHAFAREQGGAIPATVFRELIENLVHASFAGVVITILDKGNTIRISDQGPGIPDKGAALRPGFTSADAAAKLYIRGVGSGFPLVRQTLAALGGTLDIEDNLGRGTVITARVPAPVESFLAPAPTPAYNLPERQLKVLLLTVELAPVGPTRIAQELGVSTSTAYRDLVSLEQAGFVVCRPSGHRSATDAGLAYLDVVL